MERNPDILYHYCSNLAFHSIITQRKVRLSLLSMSNDAKEGQHILDVASRVMPENFRQRDDALEKLQKFISMMSAIGFCLSADGDVLSQWRGYADNAQGVAIGFDFAQLKAATEQDKQNDQKITLLPIFYDDHLISKVMRADLQPIADLYRSGKLDSPRTGTILTPMTPEESHREEQRFRSAIEELTHIFLNVANYAYMVKTPFFREEKEWRILMRLIKFDEALDLVAPEFQPSPEKLKPFIGFPAGGFSPSMVREIIVGPRNQTPPEVARLFLKSQGFDHVSLRRSVGSYR